MRPNESDQAAAKRLRSMGAMSHRRIAVIVSAMVLVCGLDTFGQDRVALAQDAYRQAIEQFDTHHDDDALRLFRASLALYPSPNTRLGAARALRNLGRIGEAAAEYERVTIEADEGGARYAQTGGVAREELAALAPRVGRVRIALADAPSGAEIDIDGRTLPASIAGVAIPVTAGDVTVRVRAGANSSAEQRVRVAAGSTVDVRLAVPAPAPRAVASTQPTPVHPPTRAHRSAAVPMAWTSGVVSALGFVAFGVFAGLAQAQYSSLQCGPVCPPSEGGAIAMGHTYQDATNVSLVVGIAAGAVMLGAVLVALVGRGHEHSSVAHLAAGVIEF